MNKLSNLNNRLNKKIKRVDKGLKDLSVKIFKLKDFVVSHKYINLSNEEKMAISEELDNIIEELIILKSFVMK